MGNRRDPPDGGANQRARARADGARRAVSAPAHASRLGALGAARVRAPAATELTLYRHENARQIGSRPLERSAPAAPVCSGTPRCCWRCSSRCTRIYSSSIGSRAGRVEAGALLGGEWWRAITALTLHIELAHLGGNLAFGAFFGYFVGRYFGTGVGWLAVLLAASVGNVAQRVAAVAGASLDRRVDGRVRGARLARRVHVAARVLARYAVARAHRADRRGPRLARVHGHGGREHGSWARICSASLRASCSASQLAHFVPTAWLKSARVQRACGALRRRLSRRRGPSACARRVSGRARWRRARGSRARS